MALPAMEPAPQAQAPVPNPEAQAPVPNPQAPGEPVPAGPQPGSRVTHPEGSDRVMPLADRTGKKAGLSSYICPELQAVEAREQEWPMPG